MHNQTKIFYNCTAFITSNQIRYIYLLLPYCRLHASSTKLYLQLYLLRAKMQLSRSHQKLEKHILICFCPPTPLFPILRCHTQKFKTIWCLPNSLYQSKLLLNKTCFQVQTKLVSHCNNRIILSFRYKSSTQMVDINHIPKYI